MTTSDRTLHQVEDLTMSSQSLLCESPVISKCNLLHNSNNATHFNCKASGTHIQPTQIAKGNSSSKKFKISANPRGVNQMKIDDYLRTQEVINTPASGHQTISFQTSGSKNHCPEEGS